MYSNTSPAPLQHHIPHIDGLRAIAILSVVLYHVGFQQLSGGYVGVDVFFVISGFLIINQINNALQNKTFTFKDFWARRVLRILPPYLLVIFTCIAIAPLILIMPDEYSAFSTEVFYSSFMFINHLLLSQQGYFDTDASSKILLHLWSLSVEEQFYLLIPILLFITWRLPRAVLLAIITAFIAISFFASVIYTNSGGKNFAFYVTALRAWEFLIGGMIMTCIPHLRKLSNTLLECIAWLSLFAILLPVFVYTHDTAFPGYTALLPVLGAAGIIATGIVNSNLVVARILSNKTAVYIGLVSYAWYLWHWPLLAFARIYALNGINYFQGLGLILIAFGLAVLTRKFIEIPVVNWRKKHADKMGWNTVIVGCLLCFLTALASIHLIPAGEKRLINNTALLPGQPQELGNCQIKSGTTTLENCIQNRPAGILIGDSHAISAAKPLSDYANRNGSALVGAIAAGCVSIMPLKVYSYDPDMDQHCRSIRDRTKILFQEGFSPSYAVLFSRWNLYNNSDLFGISALDETSRSKDPKPLFIQKTKEFFSELKSNGVKKILVIAPVPTFKHSIPKCVVRADHYHWDRDKECSATTQDVTEERRKSIEWLTKAITEYGDPNVRLLDPFNLFCDSGYCRPYFKETVYFIDTNHPSYKGMEKIISSYPGEFKWVVSH